MRLSLLAFAVLILASCDQASQVETAQRLPGDEISSLKGCPEGRGRPLQASVSDIVSNPSSFQGALVRVSGHFHDDFEHHALYAGTTPEPDEHRFKNGIWSLWRHEGLMHGPVEVVGYFTAETKGHLGQFAGSICVISAAGAVAHAP